MIEFKPRVLSEPAKPMTSQPCLPRMFRSSTILLRLIEFLMSPLYSHCVRPLGAGCTSSPFYTTGVKACYSAGEGDSGEGLDGLIDRGRCSDRRSNPIVRGSNPSRALVD